MVRSAMMERGVGAGGGFRTRGSEVSRLEGLSDAVFGFAITLLVVSLEVPRTFVEMMAAVEGFLAFAASFAILFWIWLSQYRFFRRYGLQDGPTLALNAALLFVVLFFVYPLKFVLTFVVELYVSGEVPVAALADGSRVPMVRLEDTALMMVVYGLGYVAVFGVFALLHLHAWRRRDALDLSEVERFETVDNVREGLLNVAIGVLSIGIALVGGPRYAAFAGFTYALVGPAMAGNGIWAGRRRKRLEAGLSGAGG